MIRTQASSGGTMNTQHVEISNKFSKDLPAIVVFEDDDGLAEEIRLAFTSEDYDVSIVKSQAELLAAAEREGSSFLIMDRMVCGQDSLVIVERLREAGNRVPVIVISSLVSVDDRIRGLKAGGDDYLIKPFSMGELLARAGALVRRATIDTRETKLVASDLVMDLIDRTVTRGDRAINLLPREFTLLEYFMRRQGQVITRAMMLEGVWKYKAPLHTNVVDVQLSNLRRKVDGEGNIPLFKNQRGVGFVLMPPSD